MVKNNEEVILEDEDKDPQFIMVSVGIACVLASFFCFYQWNFFGESIFIEVLTKLVSIFLAFFGFIAIGFDITERSKEEAGLTMGIGLSILVPGLMLTNMPSPFSLNVIIFIMILIGSIPIIMSIFQVSSKKKMRTSLLYKSIIIVGDLAGVVVAVRGLISILAS